MLRFPVNLQDINLCKPYKSSVARDQQVISRSTVPRSILEIYNKCDSLPPLNAFDVIRSVTARAARETGSLLPTNTPTPFRSALSAACVAMRSKAIVILMS